jgi:hypothetical protein
MSLAHGLGIDAVMPAAAERAAVLGDRVDAHPHKSAFALGGIARDDIDDAVDGVGAPQGAAWAAHHLDALDIDRRDILHVPEHPGVQRRINGTAVDQDQQLVGGSDVEAPGADRIVPGVDTPDLQVGR